MATTIEPIEQTISDIPLLRHRNTVNPTLQSDKDDFVIKYEANSDHLAETLVSELNTIKNQFNTSVEQINTVAEEITTAEESISPHYANINAVATNEDNINAVATNATNINAVATNEDNINAVVANATNINAVATNATNINAVATNEDNINAVATNMPKITNVDANMSDIVLVSDAIQAGTLPTIINDSAISTTSTWSSGKINDEITTAVGGIDLSSKQDTLISGTNIKTVNGESVLGTGNLAIAGVVADYQEFTTSGTWTKPSGCNYVYVEAWGGGGSGYVNTGTGNSTGGSGGEFINKIFKASDVTNTITVIVGSGGASKSTTAQPGSNGGDTSFGSLVLAYGGLGPTTNNANVGFKRAVGLNISSITGFNALVFPSSGYGGGLGSIKGGNTVYGGGGGGGYSSSQGGGGGVSSFGGNGGNGAASGNAGNGAFPSGGGGGVSGGGTSGAGGNGLVKVWTW